jgi:hypothetical protein
MSSHPRSCSCRARKYVPNNPASMMQRCEAARVQTPDAHSVRSVAPKSGPPWPAAAHSSNNLSLTFAGQRRCKSAKGGSHLLHFENLTTIACPITLFQPHGRLRQKLHSRRLPLPCLDVESTPSKVSCIRVDTRRQHALPSLRGCLLDGELSQVLDTEWCIAGAMSSSPSNIMSTSSWYSTSHLI